MSKKGVLPEHFKRRLVKKYLNKIAEKEGADVELFDFEAYYDPELTLEENYIVMDGLVYGYDRPFLEVREELKEKETSEEELLSHYRYLEGEYLRAKESLTRLGKLPEPLPEELGEARVRFRETEEKLRETKTKLKKQRSEVRKMKKKIEELRETPIERVVYKYPPKVPPPPPPSLEEIFNDAIRYLRKAKREG